MYPSWLMAVALYILPLDLCKTTPYLFLSMIILGPHNPKGKIDQYLQLLIDELQ